MGETANIIKMCAEAFKTKSEFEKGMIIGIMLNPASFKDDHKEDHSNGIIKAPVAAGAVTRTITGTFNIYKKDKVY